MSIKCGNHKGIDIRHETVADVRFCYENGPVVDFAPTIEGVRCPIEGTRAAEAFLTGATAKLANGHATSPILASMRPWADSVERQATPAQLGFLASLGAERDLSGLSAEDFHSMELMASEIYPSFTRASALITTLKAAPKAQRSGSQKSKAWRKLAEAIPVGRYALLTGPGQDKTHFYRLSERNGFFKLQEQASDAWYEVELKNYETILQAIVDFGVEPAGVLYGELIGQCRRCGRALTDDNNPYKAIGYGPDCGAKA
jgi:hypothetical protein